jgi:hypothetical protein
MVSAVTALAALVAGLTALLAVPVVLGVEAERGDALKVSWRVRALFGLVDVGPSRGRPARGSSHRPDSEASRPTRARTGRRRARMAMAALRTRGLLRRAVRTGSSLRRQITIHEFHLRTAFGFDSPADTGILYGCLSPLLVLAGQRGLDVQCEPMFVAPGLQGVLRASVRVRPLAVLGVLAAFVLSPPVLRALAAAWRVRK